jgi:hypothetical protein
VWNKFVLVKNQWHCNCCLGVQRKKMATLTDLFSISLLLSGSIGISIVIAYGFLLVLLPRVPFARPVAVPPLVERRRAQWTARPVDERRAGWAT